MAELEATPVDDETCYWYAIFTSFGAPVFVYAHGGGWCYGSVETVDRFCRRVADRSGCAVLWVAEPVAPWASTVQPRSRIASIAAGGRCGSRSSLIRRSARETRRRALESASLLSSLGRPAAA